MKAVPVAVRERILKLYDQGKSTGDIAASFGYCVAAVRLKGPQAPWLFGGAMDGELLLAWVKQG